MSQTLKKFVMTCLGVLVSTLSATQLSWGHPFRADVVCAPAETFKANQGSLTLELRDGGPCGPDEQWMRVDHNDGVTYLLPMAPPLPSDTQQNLKDYKNYYRIQR